MRLHSLIGRLLGDKPAPQPEIRFSYDWTGRDIIRFFDKDGLAFVHIPKTGGTAISTALYGIELGHLTWQTIRTISPAKFERWFKFAVVRDPVDRFLSAYSYLARGGANEFDRAYGQAFIAPFHDINAFIAKLAADASFSSNALGYWHFRPQWAFVATDTRDIMVNALVPFEVLKSGDAVIRGVALGNIPVVNATAGTRAIRDDLTIDSLNHLRSIYELDFRLRSLPGSQDDLFRMRF